MNLQDMSTQLLFTTVPIWVKKNSGVETGTGFIFNYQIDPVQNQLVPFLITNHHVVNDGNEALVEFIERKDEKPLTDKRIRIRIDKSALSERLGHKDVDLVAIPIAPVINQLEATGKSIFFRSISMDLIPTKDAIDDFAALEEITFIGYPSGIFDDHNFSPIVRRGITATPIWNNFKQEPIFLIDAGVFPGSSGSPVFLFNQGSFATKSGLTVGSRLHFLGVVSESFIQDPQGLNRSFIGLGKVINCLKFKEYIESVVQELKNLKRIA